MGQTKQYEASLRFYASHLGMDEFVAVVCMNLWLWSHLMQLPKH